MTPIERISTRSKALALLGIEGTPSRSEIRTAFRKLAFEKHPDHGKGTPEEFARISDAYNFLCETATDEPVESTQRKCAVSRPSVQATETEFDDATMDLCQAQFDDTATSGARHISTRLYRRGRMLTYFVPTAPENGRNLVALPTGDLIDTRRVEPRIVEVWSREVAGAVFDVPARICARLFPGARSVQVRFGAATRH